MRYTAAALLLGLLLLGLTSTARVAEPVPPREPLVERVRKAIERGIQHLRDVEGGRGDLEQTAVSRAVPGGWTALGTLALLYAGVPPDDPAIQRCLDYLRTVEPVQTYVVGLQTMVFVQAGQLKDRERIQRNVDWLVSARIMNGDSLAGWSYKSVGPVPDNSNTQYALLGLHEGHVSGARIEPKVWESIRDFYTTTQANNGGWGYRRGQDPSFTMTTAGLCGLLIAGMDLNTGREVILPNGTVQKCGEYEENRAIAKAIDWLTALMPRSAGDASRMPHTYYALYGIERAGRLTGERFLGNTDWYRVGCEFLVGAQRENGSWMGNGHEAHSVIATSFALLFLSKGRTPVLISKVVHDPENDWNNDRSDARHLVDFCSRELFKRQPLAWQVFDARRAGDLTQDRIRELTSDLLQSPIVYFNGHQAPRFRGGEEELLKEYVANGGFILAEACCGDPRFDAGFKALMGKLFPDTPLRELPPEHPIWLASGKFAVRPDRYKLFGIEMGCKTVVVYSPQDLSCWWESNRHEDRGRGQDAFRLGANIVAYATGMEPPRPRLTEVEVFRNDAERRPKRGYLKVAQVRHEGDWQPAPRAMPNLMMAMRKLGLDVALETQEIRLQDRDLVDFRFLYLHGRNAFTIPPEGVRNLRFHLETGGMLLADACCASKNFDQAFRSLVAQVWPEKKLEPIPTTDELYGRELNGTAITSVRCRREGTEFRSVTPALEGIKINGRWAVIYSKYDLGCALEKHTSPECLGHDHDSAVKLAGAAVLYALRR